MVDYSKKAQALRPAINAALALIAKDAGVSTLRLGNCRYTREGAFTFVLEGLFEGGLSREATYYDQLREVYDYLPPRGTGFSYRGIGMIIVGANKTGTKVLVNDPSGKELLFRVMDMPKLVKT